MNKENKSLYLEELEGLTSQQLDELLQEELEKETKDAEKVLQILHILEEREAGDPNNYVDVDSAWRTYQESLQKDVHLVDVAAKKDRGHGRWLGRVAAVAAIVCLVVLAAPKAMGAENIFEIIGRWTQSIFEFFDPADSTEPKGEYVFKTDHPGLQQIYDAVAAQGVTQPVVPTWVPDGYELTEVKAVSIRGGEKVCAALMDGEGYITIAIEIHNESGTNQYMKDETDVDVYEKEGVKHYIMSNEDSLQAVWNVDNIECAIRTNCDEQALRQILTSIYEEAS